MTRMRIPLLCTLLFMGMTSQAQESLRFDTVMVEARAWYRDSLRNIRYADWKAYPSAVLRMPSGNRPVDIDRTCAYGG